MDTFALVLFLLAVVVFAVATINTPMKVTLIGLGLLLLAAGEAARVV